MKADVELMIKLAEEGIEAGKKVYVELRGDSEPRGPMNELHRHSQGGAALVCQVWSNGRSFFRPEDLLAVSIMT